MKRRDFIQGLFVGILAMPLGNLFKRKPKQPAEKYLVWSARVPLDKAAWSNPPEFIFKNNEHVVFTNRIGFNRDKHDVNVAYLETKIYAYPMKGVV